MTARTILTTPSPTKERHNLRLKNNLFLYLNGDAVTRLASALSTYCVLGAELNKQT